MNKKHVNKIKDACYCVEEQMHDLINLLPYLNLSDAYKQSIEDAIIVIYGKIDEVRNSPVNELDYYIDENILKNIEYKY